MDWDENRGLVEHRFSLEMVSCVVLLSNIGDENLGLSPIGCGISPSTGTCTPYCTDCIILTRRLALDFTGTAFGKGVYFARDASYSLRYAAKAESSVGKRCMYLSRVLVGQYCNGTKAMIVPPPKDSSQPEILFDSVVDDIANPSIFVVFSDTQCYPEYVITF